MRELSTSIEMEARYAVTDGYIDEDAYEKLVAHRPFTMGPTRLLEAL